ncbi:hypothetical protein K491DRAFT_685760 [Lophiostoma macrostomum CBS 122681]|uniref:Uncharacterized protein n=1 Tax=Lophiostoma macrostomum CBS 122681 TaxID=1314788 RepID=A0A6A6SHB0_9PLEO|nr:hypothetical protein K491DRAFT_685760 [Lophiostoma macrostomum CBS 122681]
MPRVVRVTVVRLSHCNQNIYKRTLGDYNTRLDGHYTPQTVTMSSPSTPFYRPSPFGVQILQGLNQKLIDQGVHDVFLNLPRSQDMHWAPNSAGNMTHCEDFKLRVGSWQGDAVFLYLQKTFMNQNESYPPIQQETWDGTPVVGNTSMIWASSDGRRRWNGAAPFRWVSDSGVKRVEFERSFIEALTDIKNSQAYKDMLAHLPNGVSD